MVGKAMTLSNLVTETHTMHTFRSVYGDETKGLQKLCWIRCNENLFSIREAAYPVGKLQINEIYLLDSEEMRFIYTVSCLQYNNIVLR